MSMEREARDEILRSGGVDLVKNCLSSRRDETVLSAITTLMNLTTPSSRSQTADEAVVQCMVRLSLSDNARMCNLATVFLEDYCPDEQVKRARETIRDGQSQTALGIPLPQRSNR